MNVIVDPYSFFDMPRISHIDDRKVSPGKYIYPLKTLGSLRSSPTAVMLGSSRTEIGLDPRSPAWDGDTVYNLGVPGSGIVDALRYFEQVNRRSPVRRVLLGVEYSMFDGSSREVEETSWEDTADGSTSLVFYGNLLTITFSADTLIDSAATVARSLLRRPLLYRPDGFLVWRVYRQAKLDRSGGHRPSFLRLLETMRTDHHSLSPQNHRYAEALDAYRQLLRLAHRDEIDLRIFISPEHAWMTEARDALDPSSPTDTWRRDLVRINREEAERADQPAFVLWDFASFEQPDLERVPAAGDSKTRMQWWWESSHYKAKLGDVVLARVLDGAPAPAEVGNDFGVRIDDSNLEADLAKARQRRDAWAASAPDSVALLHELVREPSRAQSEAPDDGKWRGSPGSVRVVRPDSGREAGEAARRPRL